MLVSKAADTMQAERAGARRGSSPPPCHAAVRQNKPCFTSRSTTWQQQDEQCHEELQLLILAHTNDSTSHCVTPCRAGNAVMFCLKHRPPANHSDSVSCPLSAGTAPPYCKGWEAKAAVKNHLGWYSLLTQKTGCVLRPKEGGPQSQLGHHTFSYSVLLAMSLKASLPFRPALRQEENLAVKHSENTQREGLTTPDSRVKQGQLSYTAHYLQQTGKVQSHCSLRPT